jgi:hypothetical protein
VIDPGMVPSRDAILGPLRELGFAADDVTDVVISHHHPDHTLNVALFPDARLHDHWAWYRDDLWISRPAEGFELAPGIRLIETPGHSPQDISTLVDTDEGLTVVTSSETSASPPGTSTPRSCPDNRPACSGSQASPGSCGTRSAFVPSADTCADRRRLLGHEVV